MKKHVFQQIISAFVGTAFTFSLLDSNFVYANDLNEQEMTVNPTTFPTSQYTDVMTTVTATIEAWRSMGLTDETINKLLSLPVKEESFYDGIPELENEPAAINNTTFLPSSQDSEQINRIQYVSNVTKNSLGTSMYKYQEYAAKGYAATAAAYDMASITTDLPQFKKGVNDVADAYIAGYENASSMSQLFSNIESSDAIYAFDEQSQFRAVAKAFTVSFCAPLAPYTSIISGVGGFFSMYGGFFDMANKGSLDYSHSTRFSLRYYYYLTHYY